MEVWGVSDEPETQVLDWRIVPERRSVFLERNADADITTNLETGEMVAYHRSYEKIDGQLRVVERWESWRRPGS
jgi:hypothetical protein